MKSIIRFLVVMALVFGAALLWKSDRKRPSLSPPKLAEKGEDPQESLNRSLRPLGMGTVQEEWSKKVFQARLEDAFDRNDPCSVLLLQQESAPVSPEERWAAGMEVLLHRQRNPSPLLEELFASADSPLMGKPQENSRRKETLFFNALLYANQLEGYNETSDHPHRNPYRNTEKAIDTLRQLAQQDPDNGAYNFFLAQVLRYAGTAKDEVQGTYAAASKAPQFDTFYQSIYDSLLQISYENLATFSWVYLYLHHAPTPNFNAGIHYLKNWAHDADPGRWAANRIVRKFIALGEHYKTESPGYLYSQSEYLLGYALRYTLDGRYDNNREDYLKRMKDAKDFISETPPSVGLAETDLYMDYFHSKEKRDCRWAAWQSLFDAYRAKHP
jgi:hypothetical protein